MADAGADDRTLIRRHLDGDRAAFGELVARHRDRLWRVALRTLGDPDDAADAVQDALVSAYRSAGSYRGDAAVSTWLHRITVNACLDLVRRRRARPSVPLGDEDVPATADAYAARETATDVLAALRRLPVDLAAAVVLVDVEGFPVAEAAAVLEIPVGTVKSRCARARAQLAGLLGPGVASAGGAGTSTGRAAAAGNRGSADPVEPPSGPLPAPRSGTDPTPGPSATPEET